MIYSIKKIIQHKKIDSKKERLDEMESNFKDIGDKINERSNIVKNNAKEINKIEKEHHVKNNSSTIPKAEVKHESIPVSNQNAKKKEEVNSQPNISSNNVNVKKEVPQNIPVVKENEQIKPKPKDEGLSFKTEGGSTIKFDPKLNEKGEIDINPDGNISLSDAMGAGKTAAKQAEKNKDPLSRLFGFGKK